MKNKVVFIMGIGRSGSTLVELMIGSHPDCFSLGEISKLPKLLQKKKENWFAPGSTFWQDNFTQNELEELALGFSDRRLTSYIPLKVEKSVRSLLGMDAIFNPYTQLFAKTNAKLLTDSSKHVHWISNKLKAKEFRNGNVDAYLLYNVRDGRAVVNSYLRLERDSIEDISNRWVRLWHQYQGLYATFPDDKRMTVRYEELVTDPETTMEGVCRWLNLDFRPDMVEYWKHPHHHIVGSRGTSALISKFRGQQLRNLDKHGAYYQDLEFKIKLDLRWKQELSPENLGVFNRISGGLNQPYEWD